MELCSARLISHPTYSRYCSPCISCSGKEWSGPGQKSVKRRLCPANMSLRLTWCLWHMMKRVSWLWHVMPPPTVLELWFQMKEKSVSLELFREQSPRLKGITRKYKRKPWELYLMSWRRTVWSTFPPWNRPQAISDHLGFQYSSTYFISYLNAALGRHFTGVQLLGGVSLISKAC